MELAVMSHRLGVVSRARQRRRALRSARPRAANSPPPPEVACPEARSENLAPGPSPRRRARDCTSPIRRVRPGNGTSIQRDKPAARVLEVPVPAGGREHRGTWGRRLAAEGATPITAVLRLSDLPPRCRSASTGGSLGSLFGGYVRCYRCSQTTGYGREPVAMFFSGQTPCSSIQARRCSYGVST